jgi:uncharacterized protein (TIGR02145 family)
MYSKKMMKLLVFALISFTLLAQNPGTGVTDIDGNQYETVIIGSQEWMTENLKTTKYANGEAIPNVTTDSEWANLTTPAWSFWANNSQYENPYGKLYNWYTAADERNVCPAGWHVASNDDWSTLINYLDPNANGGNTSNLAGGKMKTTGQQYWNSPNIAATNESGFSGLPGGCRNYFGDGSFTYINFYGLWWTSTDVSTNHAWSIRLNYSDGSADKVINWQKPCGLSIRCVKDEVASIDPIESSDKTLLKITDILGKEMEYTPNMVQIYFYSDGSRERLFIVE